MEYRNIALFTDLDGTLLNSRREVSEENLRAIARFVEGGGLFGISTGRAPVNALDILPELPINGWSVVLNGAESYHFRRHTADHVQSLSQARMYPLIRQVLVQFPEVNVQVCTEDQLLFLSDPAFADRDFVETHQPMSDMNLEDAGKYRWLKALFCGPRPMLEALIARAQASGISEEVECVFSAYTYLEFLPKNVNKGSCVRALRGQRELKGRTFVAVGDYSNDIELLRQADIGVAVANALPEVKAVAAHTVCSNDEHALAYLIDTLLPAL